ncbi:helix-turn-helix domain-containing protein [Caulobacter sp.]|uniref:helix-turn-helix domain-containing protein n=1 Tax=Caulobacter sp. TaxID=78 RepID=UPI0025C5FDD4|nr:helix-turn-helix domain-containing protein [Caulobacter sp.]
MKSCRQCYSNDCAKLCHRPLCARHPDGRPRGPRHKPSSFLVYLAITAAHADGRASFSHAELAERTGQSRRTVQNAVENLKRRGLIEVSRQGPTEAATYVPLTPWRRQRD